ncbi:MAG: glycoside hydrolase family 3 protein [Lysobacteraceae bacterium]|nr:MAG: glycoside hydrolase family 3 protein [Xanthomonadaceae bacterium]
MKTLRVTLLTTCLAAGFAVGAKAADRAPGQVLQDWPRIESAIGKDAALEARVRKIVSEMTLAQKIGQMTQPEIKSVTPEDVRRYYLGSVLNGGGSWPAKNKRATVADWLGLAQQYHDASLATDAATPIPVIWGTDAVHGHNNVMGATLFPHNIGLGAAHDVDLIERIGAATAQSTRATGIGWVFGPTLAVAQDPRWGRTYESFSADGALVRRYAEAYVKGMQGDFSGDGHTVATAKHYIGDGATQDGKDQGNAVISRAQMINVHGQGYYGALGAGVQTVMASFNSWNDVAAGKDYGKMHGTHALLTDALKDKMGFDGFIVTDWNGIAQVKGCSNASCAQAINAGIDMVMVPDDWKAFIANTMAQVEAGEIPMARVDDAVTRILRVKLRAGLFDRKPSDGRHAGNEASLQHRELARRAVRESLVLLKNEAGALPLKRDQRILVVGKSADNASNHAGGWSLTWQGTENTNQDYPNGDTFLAALRAVAGDSNVVFNETAKGVDASTFDVVVAVIGETPYAEFNGDIIASDTLAHSRRHPEDLAVLQAAAATGKPVVTVLYSGRPLYANDLLNLSQAFVAAWLPGTEGKGITDVLFASEIAGEKADFRGKLTFPWPADPCPAPADRLDAERPPLFKAGYGLSYARSGKVAALQVLAKPNCGAPTALPIFNLGDAPSFALHVASGNAERALGADLNATLRWPDPAPALQVRTVQINTQQDAKEVTWLAPARFFSRNPARDNVNALANAKGALQFDVKLIHAPSSAVTLSMGCGGKCAGGFDLGPALAALPVGSKHTFKVPLACFAKRGADLANVEEPFSIAADAPFAAAFTNIRVVAGAAADADAFECPAIAP